MIGVESKWKDAKRFGPDTQTGIIGQSLTGSVSFFINRNQPKAGAETYQYELE